MQSELIKAKIIPGGEDELLRSEIGGLFDGIHRLYTEYLQYVLNQTKLYGKMSPSCRDHLTILWLESAVHVDCSPQVLTALRAVCGKNASTYLQVTSTVHRSANMLMWSL